MAVQDQIRAALMLHQASSAVQHDEPASGRVYSREDSQQQAAVKHRPVSLEQLNSIRTQLSQGGGGGSIEINGQSYPNEPSQGYAGNEALAATDAIRPLVKSGIVDPQQLGALLTKEIGGEFQTQQQQRKISRDINAIQVQYKAGRITDEALQKAVGTLHNEYGSALYSNPEFASLANIEDQRQVAQSNAVQAYAQSEGLPVNRVRWDERSNRPIFDSNAAAVDAYKSNMADAESERSHKARQTASQDRETKLKSVTALMQRLQTLRKDNNGTLTPAQEASEVRLTKEWLSLMHEGAGDLQPSAFTPGPTQQPIQQKTQFKTYTTKDDALKAGGAGAYKPGESILVEGVPYKLGVDNKLHRVQ